MYGAQGWRLALNAKRRWGIGSKWRELGLNGVIVKTVSAIERNNL